MTRPDDSGSVTVQVRRPDPVTDPRDLKAIAMAEYRTKLARAGRVVSEAALERFVVQELNLVDAFGRLSRPAPPTPKQKGRRTRRQSVKDRAAEKGLRLLDGPRSFDLHPATRMARAIDAKVQAATARIARILENDGSTKVADVDKAIAATAVPKLAREFIELWFHYQLRHRASRFNPFAGLNAADASRKFLRGVFDICDKSTGIPWLGHWWTASRR